MAKKSKVPRPPRPVQAPQRRVDTRSGGWASGIPPWGWGAGAVAAIAIVIGVVIGVGGAGGGRPSTAAVAKAMSAAGCTFTSKPVNPPKKNPLNFHADFPSLTTPTAGEWSTFPPSGGGHYGLWAVWGFYRQPVNPRQVVHNEEHGGVIIWWGPKVPSSTVDKLESFYEQKSTGMFGTPIAGLGNKIALTAWTGDPNKYYRQVNGAYYYGVGHLAICSGFNQKAFATFRDAFRGQGPEGIPLADDAPGMGPQ